MVATWLGKEKTDCVVGFGERTSIRISSPFTKKVMYFVHQTYNIM